MTKQKIDTNHGTVIYRVDNFVVNGCAVDIDLKNTKADVYIVDDMQVSQRELGLRVEVMIFMLSVASCFFAFLYPSWWQDNRLYFFASNISWAVAGAFVVLIFVILKNRQFVEKKICANIISMEKRKRSEAASKIKSVNRASKDA